ncbi:MAG: NifB/NifX family molybdenum-iron cluster-binding protein [Candidatus Lokiarchaeota archaeon]|nr:NifB/NifX family molybdenum-iron cluster-binding protein [Candidatus Lokiarchaeota archaeon]
MIKIVGIPSNGPKLSDNISQHFGHCKFFVGVEISDNNQPKKIFELDNSNHSGCMQTVVSMKEKSVTDMIVSGIGGRPFLAMVQSGINIYHGENGTIDENVRLLLERKLKPLGGPSCEEHNHHNHNQQCGE